MSDIELGSLLADATQAGAYFVDARDRESLVEAGGALQFAGQLVGIREVFQRFAAQTTGAVIYCAEDPEAHVLCADRPRSIGFGWDPHWHQVTDMYSTFSDKDFKLGLNAAQTTMGALGMLTGVKLKKIQ